jgi:hypothetical protein
MGGGVGGGVDARWRVDLQAPTTDRVGVGSVCLQGTDSHATVSVVCWLHTGSSRPACQHQSHLKSPSLTLEAAVFNSCSRNIQHCNSADHGQTLDGFRTNIATSLWPCWGCGQHGWPSAAATAGHLLLLREKLPACSPPGTAGAHT